MKRQAFAPEITEIISKALELSDEETRLLAERKYFRDESIVKISMDLYLSKSTIERQLKKLVDSIIIMLLEASLSDKATKALTQFEGILNGGYTNG